MRTNLQSITIFFTFTKYILDEKLSDAHIMYRMSSEVSLFIGNQYMRLHIRGNCSVTTVNSKHDYQIDQKSKT